MDRRSIWGGCRTKPMNGWKSALGRVDGKSEDGSWFYRSIAGDGGEASLRKDGGSWESVAEI